MKKLLFSAASMLLLLGSCSQNELEEDVLSQDQSVVTATIEGQGDSRLAVNYDETNNVFKLSWSTGDSFKVFDGGEGAVYNWTSGNDFTASTTPTNPTYAVYPYTESNGPSISGSTVTMTLSATPSVANVNLPMWASAPTNNNYAFKHLAAGLQFTLNDIPAGYNQLVVTASNAISGTFTADLNSETPVLLSASTTEADKKVTVSFEAATTGTKNQVFYIPLPAGTYTSLAVSVSNSSETKELKSWSNLEVVRGKMYYTTAIVDASSVTAVNQALANVGEVATTVTLTEEITTDSSIEIPNEAKDVTLNFATVPVTSDTAPLVINQNETAASGEATSVLNVTMPNDATGLHATIDAPTTTVTLEGGSYSKVTATTATNTLIIGENVTIEELIINGGNIVLKGNVKKISSTVATTVKLVENVTLSSTLTILAGAEVTLDLNGYTISQEKECTGSYDMILNKGTLTIKDTSSEGNGKISFKDLSNGGGDSWGSYVINNNTGTLVIENGTLEHLGSADENFDTNLPIQNYAGKVTINGGKISSPQFRSVRDFTAGGEIIINGGVFEGQVWMQGLGTGSSSLTITGGEFGPKANDGSSVYITNGTNDVKVSIKGGKFNTKIGCADATKAGVKGSVTGGIFTESAKSNTNSALIAEGCTFEPNTDGTYTLGLSFVKVDETSYQIHNVAGLKLFRDAVNAENTFEGCTIELMNDLDLNNENWTPIGFNSKEETGDEPYFSGTFDGKNHTINNLKIDVKDQGGVGLFGAVHNATFKDFTINNVDIKAVESEEKPEHKSGSSSGDNYYIVGGQLGAVAGYDAKNGTVTFDNVHVKGLIKIEGETRAKQGQRVAGVFGGKGSSVVSFNNVTVKGDNGSYIKGYCSTAGVMGQNGEAGTFANVSTDIDITCFSFGAGGVVGIACQGSIFTNCSSAGDITRNEPLDETKSSLYRIGGIAGCWSAANKTHTLTLTNCSYSGTLASLDADSKAIDNFDFVGLVGRAYDYGTETIGSTVTIDGNKYVDEGSGIYSINDAYQIGTLAALKWFANEVSDGNTFEGQTVNLTADIDLKNEQWIPIGNKETFNGTFNGNGHTIFNLKHHFDGEQYFVGLFGCLDNATVKDLKITNVDIKLSGTDTWGHIGAVAGWAQGTSSLQNITVDGSVKIEGEMTLVASQRIGAVVGGNQGGNISFTNVTVNADANSYVKGNSLIGGIAGQLQGESSFKDCVSNINVIAYEHSAGGIIGTAPVKASFVNCNTAGNISVDNAPADEVNWIYRVGGIVGSWAESTNSPLTLTNCSYTGTLVGKNTNEETATTFDCDGYVGRGWNDTVGVTYNINGKVYVNEGDGKYTISAAE